MAKKEVVQERIKEIQLVIFRLRNEEFAAEISAVLEISRVLDITHVPDAPGFITGVVNLRGQVMAVIDLAKQFGLGSQAELSKTARIVVVEIRGETIGLLVDEVPEVLRIAQDDIEPTPDILQTAVSKHYVKGVGKLGERLVMLLDLEKILEPQEVEQVTKITEGGTHGQHSRGG